MLLLAHLCMVSCHGGPRTAHWGHVWVPRGPHHGGHVLSGVHVGISCVDVLVGFARMHGAMADRRLHCPLRRDDSGAGEELVDR